MNCLKVKKQIKSLQKRNAKDFLNIMSEIFEQYDIYDRTTNNKIAVDEIISQYDPYKPDIERRCLGVLSSGQQCTRNPLEGDHSYCLTHYRKYLSNKKPERIEKVKVEESIVPEIPEDWQKVYIGDSAYFTCGKYLYDTETSEKVGIQENEDFILTDDPFILGF